MTLYRQLIIFTLLLFFILLAGTWMITFENNRSFVIRQLDSHAQDTATSLALAISRPSVKSDEVRMEVMINAVFDRGYYEIIRLTDLQGKVLSERKHNVIIEGVPRWFVLLVPIETPEATANIITGWRQTGTIFVKSHPGYAYQTLWLSSVRTTILFVVCGIFVLLAGAWGLRKILLPLAGVQDQADAICRKEYNYQEILPGTKELRKVVLAMNRMVKKVQTMFEEQVAVVEEFRRHAYYDPLTGLGNRRFLEGQVKVYLEQRQGDAKGVLLLVQLNGLGLLNQTRGLEAGDALLKETAKILREIMEPYSNHVVTRLTGGDFCIFLPDALPGDAGSVASNVINKLCGLESLHISEAGSIAHAGAATFACSAPLSLLLSEADRALRLAQQAAPNCWHIIAMTDEAGKMPAGQQQWKTALEKVIQDRGINLFVQPVAQTADRGAILHLEIFSRITQPEEGRMFNADWFLPYAERLGLIPLLDRIVLEEVLKLDRSQLNIDQVAVNISPASLSNSAFIEWIHNTLKKSSSSVPGIIFEFPEFAAIHNLPLIREFQMFVKDHGHDIAIDHFGRGLSNFAYLHSLQPKYVKINRAYTEEIKDAESDTRFFIASLCTIAHSVDVAVIAVGIETELQYKLLRDINIDGVQGFFIDTPKPISHYLKER